MPDNRDARPEGSRRSFLGITAILGAAMGAMLGFPIGALFAAPLLRPRGEDGTWVPVGAADGFGEEHKEVAYTFVKQDGWYRATRAARAVVRKQPDGFVALSTKCTHVGCGVVWKPEEKKFLCPCHNGEFDAEGRPTVPPPTIPLARLETRVNGETGQLEVKES
jgi:menaquinol-cytochrome c reductase iron-sulfur subunit